MKFKLLYLFLLLSTMGFAESGSHDCASMKDSHEQCPFHKDSHKEMNERGDQVMGFPQEKTTHHFILEDTGGTILVEAKDPADKQTIKQIQTHMDLVASSFAAGDFTMPHSVHLQVPPGADAMKAQKDKIQYEYKETERGGMVLITTEAEQALTAIRQFLQFQIQEHHTGDPLTVK